MLSSAEQALGSENPDWDLFLIIYSTLIGEIFECGVYPSYISIMHIPKDQTSIDLV